MIKAAIQEQLKTAMRTKNTLALDALRYSLSEIKYVEIDKKRELTDEEIIDVLVREVKKREDAIKLFKDSGRMQLVEEEEEKLSTIRALLPEQLSKEEVEKLVDEAISQAKSPNMGEVMRVLMPKVKGRADGKLVSALVKDKLSFL